MKLDVLRVKIEHEHDIEKLREYARLLTKMVCSDVHTGGGYCVVNDHNRQYPIYHGSRESCIAFIEGYEAVPESDMACFDHSTLCVCVDVPSQMVVIPEERFGEELSRQ